jgi:hypothetical protein
MLVQSWATFSAVSLGLALALAVGSNQLGIGPRAPGGLPPASDWRVRLGRVQDAVARGNATVAILEWREAHASALSTREWERMADIGDAAVAIAALGPSTRDFSGEARRAYLMALFRARDARSKVGLLRVAGAFRTLGDGEAAAQAERLAAGL